MRRARAVARRVFALLGVVLMAGAAGCGMPLVGDTPSARQTWLESLRDERPRATTGGTTPSACLANEDAAVERAVASSPEAARFDGQARTLAAQGEVSFADAPELRFSDLRLDRMLGGPERAEIALRVPLARPGTLSGQRQLLLAEAEVAQTRARLERVRLGLEVRQAWARLDGAEARKEIAVAEAARLAQALSLEHESNALEREALRADSLRAEAELASAIGEAGEWRAVLATLAGAPPCEQREAISTLSLEGLGAAAGDALAGRAELDRLFAERRHAELSRALAERETWPWFEWVQVGYEVDRGFFPDTFGFALSVSLPIGAWDGAAAEAERVRVRAIDDEARLWVARIESEVEAVGRELEARLTAMRRLDELVASMPTAGIDRLRDGNPDEVLAADLLGLHRDRARLERAAADARLAVLLTRARLLSVLGR